MCLITFLMHQTYLNIFFAKHHDLNCWRENILAMHYSVQACSKLKCHSKHVQSIIQKQTLYWINSSLCNMFLDDMICLGKNLTAILRPYKLPPSFIVLYIVSICTYYSDQVLCLISFERASPSCEEMQKSENAIWNSISPAGFEPTSYTANKRQPSAVTARPSDWLSFNVLQTFTIFSHRIKMTTCLTKYVLNSLRLGGIRTDW